MPAGGGDQSRHPRGRDRAVAKPRIACAIGYAVPTARCTDRCPYPSLHAQQVDPCGITDIAMRLLPHNPGPYPLNAKLFPTKARSTRRNTTARNCDLFFVRFVVNHILFSYQPVNPLTDPKRHVSRVP